MDYLLWTATLLFLAFSFCRDRGRTLKALRMSGRKMLKMAPLFFTVMALYALLVVHVPPATIREALGTRSVWAAMAVAAGAGSVALMPGFVAFPLCAALRQQGAAHAALAVFSVSLMCVGAATFPLEARFLGWKVALARNLLGLVLALLTGLVVGLAFGELGL